MSTDNIEIKQEDLAFVQELCNSVTEKEQRSRAIANALAVNTAAKFFNSGNVQVDTESGLYRFGDYFSDYNLADLYINNCYTDVRLYFTDDELGVPKAHFDNNTLPIVYIFLKVTQDLSSAEVKGFIRPEDIDRTNEAVFGYYQISETMLSSYYDIESRLKTKLDIENIEDEILYEIADGKYPDVSEVVPRLIDSKSARYKLQKIIKASSLYKAIPLSVAEETISSEGDEEFDLTEYTESHSDIEAANEAGQNSNEVDLNDDIESLYAALDEDEKRSAEGYKTEVTPNYEDSVEENDKTEVPGEENSEQIDTLFGENDGQQKVNNGNKSGIFGFIVFVLVLLAIGSGIYFFQNHFQKDLPAADEVVTTSVNTGESVQEQDTESLQTKTQAEENAPMPVETVENNNVKQGSEFGNPVAIPEIERNLDASILVSNLRVDWEVPEGYVSNTAAKRYLVKLGKVIQLNLKTELLLLNRPPISNKIGVEITYDAASGKFVFVRIIESSGEKTVDDAITDTVKAALENGLTMNTDSFVKLKGNPVLRIRL